MGNNIISQLLKLNKLLALAKRKNILIDITVDEKFAATKELIKVGNDIQGRTVKVGFQQGGLEIAYFIFGQNTEKPEAQGILEVNSDFVDAAIEQLYPQVREVLAADLVNNLVAQKLKELGL